MLLNSHEPYRLYRDCELRTVNLPTAAPSLTSTMSLSQMAGGGSLPCLHQNRRHVVIHARLPTMKCESRVAYWRGTPVFPRSLSVAFSLSHVRQGDTFQGVDCRGAQPAGLLPVPKVLRPAINPIEIGDSCRGARLCARFDHLPGGVLSVVTMSLHQPSTIFSRVHVR